MPSLLVTLALALAAAWLATRPAGGAWFEPMSARVSMALPLVLTLGWVGAYLLQALIVWTTWRRWGRGAMSWCAACAVQYALWLGWSWTLFHWHRPGWSLGVLTLSGCLQLALLIGAPRANVAVRPALLLTAAWLAWLWWIDFAWWRNAGGGWESMLG